MLSAFEVHTKPDGLVVDELVATFLFQTS